MLAVSDEMYLFERLRPRHGLQDLRDDELRAAYGEYVEAHRDQRRIRGNEVDNDCLETFFQHRKKVQTVTIDLGLECDSDGLISHTALSETLTVPVCDTMQWKDGFDWFVYGVQPVYTIARAFRYSPSSVQKLTLINMSSAAFFMSCNKFSGLRMLIIGLRELRIPCYTPLSSITWIAPRSDDECQNDNCESNLAKDLRGAEHLLATTPNLEVLELHCLDSFSIKTDNCLSRTTRGCKWPTLRKLSLSGFCMYEFDLVRFLFEIAGSLEELSSSNFSSVNGTWNGVLRQAKGRMTKLTKIKVKV